MKKIIGCILLVLFFALLYAGETLIFILVGTFVGAALIIGFMALVEWLID